MFLEDGVAPRLGQVVPVPRAHERINRGVLARGETAPAGGQVRFVELSGQVAAHRRPYRLEQSGSAVARPDSPHLAEGFLQGFSIIGQCPNHQVSIGAESRHVIPAAHHYAVHRFFQTVGNAFQTLRVSGQRPGPAEHHVQGVILSGVDFVIIDRVIARVAGDFRSGLNGLGMSHGFSFDWGCVICVMRTRMVRARILAAVRSAGFRQRRVGVGLHRLFGVFPACKGGPFVNQVSQFIQELRVRFRGGSPPIVQAQFLGGSGSLGVEVIDDFHMVRNKTEGSHDDPAHPGGRQIAQVVINIGFQPRLVGGTRTRTKRQRPRHFQSLCSKSAVDGLRYREVLGQVGPPLPQSVLLTGHRRQSIEGFRGEVSQPLA